MTQRSGIIITKRRQTPRVKIICGRKIYICEVNVAKVNGVVSGLVTVSKVV